MSTSAFAQCERDYNAAEEMREHASMERKASIADSATYTHTVALAEKYRAQRDELLAAIAKAEGR